MMYRATIPSPVGILTLASDGQALTGLWLEGQKYFGAGLEPEAAAGTASRPAASTTASRQEITRFFMVSRFLC